MQHPFRSGLSILTAFLLASPALAQWSSDPAVNLAVGDAASDQNQVKMVADLDGRVWMSWLDGIGSGWDVRLQRLDRLGNEILPHNGVLVADRSFSSTQDYGLDMARNGEALLAYRDDSSGSTEISANRIDATGNLLWGPGGVTLTNGAGFVAAPKIMSFPNFQSMQSWQDSIVGWTENSEVKLMRLNEAGVPQWAAPVTLTAPSGSYVLSDMKLANWGEVVISMVHQTGGFTSPKHLVAQKFDVNGAPLWGAAPVAIFDGGSLQFGNFPTMLQGNSATIFTWYTASPTLQCFVQKIDHTGAEIWAHNGVAVADIPGQLRVNPHASYNFVNDSVYITWKELNGAQSQSGISAQRLDAGGNRMWGSAGTTLEPLGANDHNMARIVPKSTGGRTLVFWDSAPSFGNSQLYGAVLDSAGAMHVPRFDVSSTPSGKARLAVSKGTYSAVLAWSDSRNDGGDIYAQAVSYEGLLEAPDVVGSPFCSPASGNSSGQSADLSGSWITGTGIGPVLSDLHLEVTGGPAGQLGYFLVGTSATAGIPISNGHFCLVGAGGMFYRYNVAGTNMNSIGGFDASGTLVNAVGTSSVGTGFDVPSTIAGFVPITIVAGDTWHYQCWYRDTAAGAGTSNFSSALTIRF